MLKPFEFERNIQVLYLYITIFASIMLLFLIVMIIKRFSLLLVGGFRSFRLRGGGRGESLYPAFKIGVCRFSPQCGGFSFLKARFLFKKRAHVLVTKHALFRLFYFFCCFRRRQPIIIPLSVPYG